MTIAVDGLRGSARVRRARAWAAKAFVAMLALRAVAPMPAAADGDDAMRRVVAGDCKGAGEAINEGLARGEARAYLVAGYLYDVTGCVEHDAAKAARFYRTAMKLGDKEAGNFLGLMYGLGNGVPQDYREAYRAFVGSRSGDSEFEAVAPEKEAAAGYAYTITQLARTKATYPWNAEPGVVSSRFDVSTGKMTFTDASPSRSRLRWAVREAYEAAIRDAPPLDPAASHDFEFEVPWHFRLE